MDEQKFMNIAGRATARSFKILESKGKEYTTEDGDRLGQFKVASGISGSNEAEALLGMMNKHYSSVVDMAKHPKMHNLETWREKLDDIRNYTLLFEGVLIDMEVE